MHGTIQDVTERHVILRELEQAREEADEANQAKGLFLANMSHELRTPLNAIIGYSEMLLEEAEDEGDDVQASDLRKIRGAGKHLLGLIDDVLDLSKIEAGQMELVREELDIEALVADVATVARPLVEKRHNQLIVDAKGAAARGPFFGDPLKLRQVLLNLLANAAKFTESGTIRLEVLREKGTLRFVVMDTGIGMDVLQRSRLFSVYSQADPAISRTYGGTGLGLAICRRYLDRMNGDIQVVSAPGQGSTFNVVLPDGH
jgi:signal transduction histidine kinase